MLDVHVFLTILLLINFVCICATREQILVIENHKNSLPKHLPRFWTNTGFCPIGDNLTEVLLSQDTFTNIEFLASLPNQGLNSIRIHWLLDLINFSNENYDFQNFDKILAFIDSIGLQQNLEFMSHHSFMWELIAFKILTRYAEKFGKEKIQLWKLESWNEPDLKSYNVLNFTTNDYLTYLQDLNTGLANASNFLNITVLKLIGPAGLFKNKEKHPMCWQTLEMCEHECPFHEITFHRKGNGTAASILDESFDLLRNITEIYPALGKLKFSNDEADPIVNWSIEREFQADVRYAAILAETVLVHWSAMYQNRINLGAISHDNAFLSFYPHQFTQRTLLARFQINNTNPVHTQFIPKPVFMVLGLLSQLGVKAYDVETKTDWHGFKVTYLTTISDDSEPFFLSTVLVLQKNPEKTKKFQLKVKVPLNIHAKQENYFIVEGLILNKTDPYHVWQTNGSPMYPNPFLRFLLRKSATPLILQQNVLNQTSIVIPLKNILKFDTSILLVRVCSGKNPVPKKVFNLRIRQINMNEILLFWSDHVYPNRCIKTYQVYFRGIQAFSKWINISRNLHTPYMFFHHQTRAHFKSIIGCYKIRSVDVFGRKSVFSTVKCLLNI